MSIEQYNRVGFMRFLSSLRLFWDVDYVVRVSMCEMHYGFITSIIPYTNTHSHSYSHTTKFMLQYGIMLHSVGVNS